MTVLRTAIVTASVLLLTACSTADPSATPSNVASSAAATGSPSAAASPSAAKLRAMDLMVKAGCSDPKVIGTQLYSFETGRCKVGKDQVEITIAVFDTDQLRDSWVNAAKSFGGNLAVGTGWALAADSPDTAAEVAAKLGGKVV